MLPARGPCIEGEPELRVPVQRGARGGSPHGEVQCIMGNGHMGPLNRQTQLKILPFSQLHWWAVTMSHQ